MHKLIYGASKYSFFLLLLLSFPLILNMPFLLKIWLTSYPDYTVSFTRLMICCTIVDAVANPLMISASATGRVKKYQSVIGGILLCILPISYIVLRLGGNPISVFVVHLSICIIAFVVRLFVVRPMIQLSLRDYGCKVVLRSAFVCFLPILLPCLLKWQMKDDAICFFVTSILFVVIAVIMIYFVGLQNEERIFVKDKITKILRCM